MSTISVETIEELAALALELTKQGLTFNATCKNGCWVVTLTGGY